MVPEHSTHTNYRNTVYQHRSEPNHSEGTKTTICYKVHFWIKFSFQLLSACCQSSPQTAGDCTKKSNSPDTLCELLTRRLLFGRYTYRTVNGCYTYYKHFQFIKYYLWVVLPIWQWLFHWDLVGALSREYVICLCSVKICILKTVYVDEYGKQPSTFINSKTTNTNNHTNAQTTNKWISLILDILCLQSLNFIDPWLRFWFDIHPIFE